MLLDALPAGAALARDVGPKGDLAVQGATKAGAAVQEAVPKGAKDPNTREQRNSSCVAQPLLCSNPLAARVSCAVHGAATPLFGILQSDSLCGKYLQVCCSQQPAAQSPFGITQCKLCCLVQA